MKLSEDSKTMLLWAGCMVGALCSIAVVGTYFPKFLDWLLVIVNG